MLFQGTTEVFVGIGFMSGPPIGGFLYAVSNYDADAFTNWINVQKDVYVKFVSSLAPLTHAWTPEKKRLILIILQFESFPYFDY